MGHQVFRLGIQAVGGGGHFFDQGCVLLRDLVHLRHGGADLGHALRLLVAGIRSLGENYIAARITVDEAANRTRIEVWDLGPQPKRGPRHTRRDVHNCADAVMDALQRLAFNDDRQARIVVTRHGEVTG